MKLTGLVYLARTTREIGTNPIQSMTNLLENKGTKVIEADIPGHVDDLICHVRRTDSRPTEAIVVAR